MGLLQNIRQFLSRADSPPVGEVTRAQTVNNGGNMAIVDLGLGTNGLSGFPAPLPSTYETYRQIIADPTVAEVRQNTNAPVRKVTWRWKAKPGTPAEWLTLVEDTMGPLMWSLIDNCLRGLDYGNQPFERVWEYKDDRLIY